MCQVLVLQRLWIPISEQKNVSDQESAFGGGCFGGAWRIPATKICDFSCVISLNFTTYHKTYHRAPKSITPHETICSACCALVYVVALFIIESRYYEMQSSMRSCEHSLKTRNPDRDCRLSPSNSKPFTLIIASTAINRSRNKLTLPRTFIPVTCIPLNLFYPPSFPKYISSTSLFLSC